MEYLKSQENDDIILWTEKNNTILLFNQQGELIHQLTDFGRGAGEYIYLNDSYQLARHNLRDYSQQKVLIYDHDLKFKKEFYFLIQEIKIDRNININNISNIDNDHLVLFTGYSDKNSCISILNIGSHEIKKLLFNIPHYAQNSQSELDQTFTKYKESVLFKSLFDYNVFQITPDSIIPQYQFDFKKYNISFESFDGKIETVIAYIRRDDYISEPESLLENDEYIYCNFFKGGKFYELYYNKQQQRPYLFNAETLPEEFASIYSNPKYAKNNYFIFTITDEDHLHTLLKLHQASTNHIKLIYTPLVSQENLENNNPHLLFIYTK
ncbi:MAG: 6-bladed beta-propeller [Butyricimonas faecihominis]